MTMLDRMRRHKSWLKWSLLLIVVAFIAFYIPSFLDNPAAVAVSSNETVAEVDGVELTAGRGHPLLRLPYHPRRHLRRLEGRVGLAHRVDDGVAALDARAQRT